MNLWSLQLDLHSIAFLIFLELSPLYDGLRVDGLSP